MSNFLVTGGAGFIGSNIVSSLLTQGHQVRVIDNLLTGKRENLSAIENDIEFIEGDLREFDTVKQAVTGIDYVLHQGALPSVPRSVSDPIISNAHNVDATLNLLVAARDAGVKRIVFAASSSAYGSDPTLPKIETIPPHPLSPYAITKYTGELYCQVFTSIYGLETICLRYFNVFGPRQDPASQYAAVIPKFITFINNDQPPTIYGDGEQSRDFTYIDNVVNANIKAAFASKEACGKTFNIACGERTSLNKLVGKLKEIMNSEVEPVYMDERIGDVKHSLADITAAQKYLGYEVNVKLEEGLKKTVDWFTS